MTTSLLSSTRTIRLGADIGGTKTEVVAIDQHNTVLHALRRPTGFGRDQVLATLFGLVRELLGNETLPSGPSRAWASESPGRWTPGRGPWPMR